MQNRIFARNAYYCMITIILYNYSKFKFSPLSFLIVACLFQFHIEKTQQFLIIIVNPRRWFYDLIKITLTQSKFFFAIKLQSSIYSNFRQLCFYFTFNQYILAHTDRFFVVRSSEKKSE